MQSFARLAVGLAIAIPCFQNVALAQRNPGLTVNSREFQQELVNRTISGSDAAATAANRGAAINIANTSDPDTQLASILLSRRADFLGIGKKGHAKLSKSKLKQASVFQIPALAPPLRIGDIGPVPRSHVNIHQVHGPLEFRAAIVPSNSADVEVIIRGVQTAGMSDKSGQPFTTCLRVTGSASYVTVAGGRRTLPLLEPFDTTKAEHLFAEAVAKESDSKHPAQKPVNVDADARAKARLSNARNLAKPKLYDAAEKKLRQIIKDVPGTPTAAEAQKELDEMPSH
jgi:hypothetical protein